MADDGEREAEHRRAGDVAAGERGPGLLRHRLDSVQQLQALVLVEVLRDPEDDVGLARPGSHRGEIGEGGGERLVPDGPEGGRLAAEVDAIDQRVHGCRGHAGRIGDRRVIAAPDHDPPAALGRRAGVLDQLDEPGDQIELPHWCALGQLVAY